MDLIRLNQPKLKGYILKRHWSKFGDLSQIGPTIYLKTSIFKTNIDQAKLQRQEKLFFWMMFEIYWMSVVPSGKSLGKKSTKLIDFFKTFDFFMAFFKVVQYFFE